LNGDGAEKFVERVKKSRKTIGELLMDQSVAAGIGNIFRAELLFRARLNPFTPGNKVEESRLRSIWKEAGVLMKAAMVDRRIVTTKPKDRPHTKGQALKEETHYVYRRQGRPCFVCGTKILTEVMAGRNLFWCPVDQAA
jgi:endonuclease-8